MPIKNRIAELADEIALWRHDLHRHPELDYDVHRTAGIVAEKLKEFGCDEIITGIGKTGVVGIITGRVSGDRVIGLRADMDALPIHETSGKPHASLTPEKCMLVVMMVIRPCYWALRNIWPRQEILPAKSR